jgi:hypothetical protein
LADDGVATATLTPGENYPSVQRTLTTTFERGSSCEVDLAMTGYLDEG